MSVKQAIIIRRDLKMRRGKEIAQGAHAAVAALLDDAQPGPNGTLVVPLWPDAWTWLREGCTKITLQVPDEAQLLAIRDRAEAAGIPHALIQDAGRTEFGGVPTFTALAIGPASAAVLGPITGDLKLY